MILAKSLPRVAQAVVSSSRSYGTGGRLFPRWNLFLKCVEQKDIPVYLLAQAQQRARLTTATAAASSLLSRTKEPSPWPPAQLAEARHLLRALLRESTYLPDPHARLYMCDHVLQRFRAYTSPSKPVALLKERRAAQVKLARKALSELRRANLGELKVLTKVLHLTYGRTGKRRHELMLPLLSPDSPSLETPVAAIPTSASDTLRPDPRPELTTRLKALLVSQVRTQPVSPTRAHPKQLAPKIPEKNQWGRPMPWKRVVNATQAWYAKMLDRTLPPLPTREWEELKARALGTLHTDVLVARRTKGTCRDGVHRLKSREILENELQINNVKSTDMILEKVDEKARGRVLTKRFMQRRWASVFAQCAKMDWDEKTNRWTVVWGSDALEHSFKMGLGGSGSDGVPAPFAPLPTFAPSSKEKPRKAAASE